MIIKDRLVNLTENITDGEHSSVKNKKGSNYYLLSNNNIEFEKIHITEKDREISKESFLKRVSGLFRAIFIVIFPSFLFDLSIDCIEFTTASIRGV